jgi:hypothetical protein
MLTHRPPRVGGTRFYNSSIVVVLLVALAAQAASAGIAVESRTLLTVTSSVQSAGFSATVAGTTYLFFASTQNPARVTKLHSVTKALVGSSLVLTSMNQCWGAWTDAVSTGWFVGAAARPWHAASPTSRARRRSSSASRAACHR